MKTALRRFGILCNVLVFSLILLFVCRIVLTIWNYPTIQKIVKESPSPPRNYSAIDETVSIDPGLSAFMLENNLSPADYPSELISLLNRNPDTAEFVYHYPLEKDLEFEQDLSEYTTDTVPLFLQWDRRWGYREYGNGIAGLTACGPVCLSMVAYYLSEDTRYTPGYMMTFAEENGYCVPGDGTSWTLFSEGVVSLGFDVTEIPLDMDRIFENLEVGNPIVCAMGPGDFTSEGHFVVMVAVEDGFLRIHDPNSIANSSTLWDYGKLQSQIENLWVIR